MNNNSAAFTSHVYEMPASRLDSFKYIKGNRPINQVHVRGLIRKMQGDQNRAGVGNMTKMNQILVNENLEVFDGQHRLEALKSLGWPAYYIIRTDLKPSDMIDLNSGHKAWSWSDFSRAYESQGNKQYADFNEIITETGIRFSNLLAIIYSSVKDGNNRFGTSHNGQFRSGDLPAFDKDEVMKTAEYYMDLIGALADPRADKPSLFIAYRSVLLNHDYDHTKFLKMAKIHRHIVFACWDVKDYSKAMYEIYQYSLTANA